MTEVAVVGAGLMGHALALVFALGGHQVRLTDKSRKGRRRVETQRPTRCLGGLEDEPNVHCTAMCGLERADEVIDLVGGVRHEDQAMAR